MFDTAQRNPYVMGLSPPLLWEITKKREIYQKSGKCTVLMLIGSLGISIMPQFPF